MNKYTDPQKSDSVGVINFPMSFKGSKAGSVPLSNLLKILSDLSLNIFIITDSYTEKIIIKKFPFIKRLTIIHKPNHNPLIKIFSYILVQLKLSVLLSQIRNKTDYFIFFMMGQNLILPMIMAKIFRKKVALVFTLSSTECIKAKKNFISILFSKVLNLIVQINCRLSNKIIVYSTLIIKEYQLEKFIDKITIAHEHSLNFDKFKITKKIFEREDIIGFVGRLSDEKGVLNLLETIPDIIINNPNLKFVIIGDGYLYKDIKQYLDDNYLNSKVKLVGWIPHENLPDYLNEMKLLILPSYTEGLPNIVIESMACGTPVLATSVGSIPELISDTKTGFIMSNNSKETISENIGRAMGYEKMEELINNAHDFVFTKFEYKKTLNDWKTLLEDLNEN